MQCPTCKQNLEDGIRFCPHDGTPLIETAATRTDSTPTGGHRPATKDLELPVLIDNRWRLEEVRGGGGMAKVYRAIDVTLEREVAVKLINPDLRNDPEFDARFKREAKIASQLADPHIVVVHDYGLDTTHGPFLVMEYLHGQSLRERLAATGPMPLKACLQLAGQLLLALIHAHGKGIVHRDIKPDNIFLLNQSGVRLHVRVLDFGIARIYRGDGSEYRTQAGAVLGTPRYMSPEQLAGQAVDARSDLYSAALVIWEALTGQLPYLDGKKLCEVCPEASPALQDLLEQCLKPNSADRPPTAVEVYLRLQELGKASGILLLPPGAMDRLVAARKSNEPTVAYLPSDEKKKVIKRRVLLGFAGAIVLLGVVALGKTIFFGDSGRHEGPENINGVAIGEAKETAEKRLGLTKEYVGHPWKERRTKDHLGHLLQDNDLGLIPAQVAEIVTMRTPDDRIAVLFHNERVIAIIASHPAAKTAGGIRPGEGVDRLFKRYDQPAQVEDKKLPEGHVELRRCRELGIGFEVQGGKVVRVTLFPATTP
jgi:serine/threonine-protein kinase